MEIIKQQVFLTNIINKINGTLSLSSSRSITKHYWLIILSEKCQRKLKILNQEKKRKK